MNNENTEAREYLPKDEPIVGIGKAGRNPVAEIVYRTWKRRSGRFAILIVVAFGLAAIAAPLITPASPSEQFRGEELQNPSLEHILGTDQIGRDLYTRIIYGARTSLVAGVLAVSLGAFVGITSGLMAGYNGGWIDAVVMRFYDGLMAFPGILLAIAIVAASGPGLLNVAIAIGIAQAPLTARLARSIVLSQKERDYVLAARSLGASGFRMVFFHILPNTLPLMLVQFSIAMGWAVLIEGSLSFLGFGVQPPTPSWGGMLTESRPYMHEMPLYALWPGLALATLLVALNFLADALRDATDPRLLR